MARRRRHKKSGTGLLGLLALGAIAFVVDFVGKHMIEVVTALVIVGVLWIAYLITRPKDIAAVRSSSPPAPDLRHFREAPSDVQQVEEAAADPEPTYSIPPPPKTSNRSSKDGSQFWRKPGNDALVNNRILGSMIYVGTGLRSVTSSDVEPALIDPTLPVDRSIADCHQNRLNYWPSYSEATPQARGAYLHWLNTGRKDPAADIGYVFLYFYGLERRAIHDSKTDPFGAADLPAIRSEVDRLLRIYGNQNSFNGYAHRLLDFIAVTDSPDSLYSQPPLPNSGRLLSDRDRLALAQCALARAPLPAAWALHWLKHDPNTSLGTAARRCPNEFAKLFEALYMERYETGLVLPINRTKLTFQYHPASPSLRGAMNALSHSTNLPEVTVLTAPLKKLAELAAETCNRLARFSRAVGKDPTSAQSFEGLVELPMTLWPEQYRHPLESVRDVVARAGQPAAIPFSKFRTWIPEFDALTRAKLKALTTALAGVGLGMEPDLRFGGGPPPFESRVVLFADDTKTAAEQASAQYFAAALTLQLAVAVAAADGSVAETERALMIKHMDESLNLTESERRRLQALLRLLLIEPPKLTGIKKKIDALSTPARQAVGDFLVLIAQADNQVTPQEIRTLQKVFGLLGLDSEAVFSKLHAAAISPGAAARPTAAPAPSQFTIPRPAASSRTPDKQRRLTLDPEKIRARQTESERVASILASVFETPTPEAEPADASNTVADQDEAGPCLLGLDPVHSALLATLITRPQWAREELTDLAEDRDLMLEGALERLNEACFDKLDMPLFDDGEPLVLNQEALAGVLSDQHPQP